MHTLVTGTRCWWVLKMAIYMAWRRRDQEIDFPIPNKKAKFFILQIQFGNWIGKMELKEAKRKVILKHLHLFSNGTYLLDANVSPFSLLKHLTQFES